MADKTIIGTSKMRDGVVNSSPCFYRASKNFIFRRPETIETRLARYYLQPSDVTNPTDCRVYLSRNV